MHATVLHYFTATNYCITVCRRSLVLLSPTIGRPQLGLRCQPLRRNGTLPTETLALQQRELSVWNLPPTYRRTKMQSDTRALIEDEEVFGDMQQPTAGYLFAEELDIHFLALDEFHSMLLRDSTIDTSNCTQSTALMDCVSPSSPSSVMYMPPCEDGDNTRLFPKHDPYAPVVFPTSNTHTVIKPELATTQTYPHPVPVPVILDDIVTDDEDKERLRRRQRGYEKRYRGRKRVSTFFGCHFSIELLLVSCGISMKSSLNLM